jgi:hypothetical protein
MAFTFGLGNYNTAPKVPATNTGATSGVSVGAPINPNQPANGSTRNRNESFPDGSWDRLTETWNAGLGKWEVTGREQHKSPAVEESERQRMLASSGQTTEQFLNAMPAGTAGGVRVSSSSGGSGGLSDADWREKMNLESELALKALKEKAALDSAATAASRQAALSDRSANQQYIDTTLGKLGVTGAQPAAPAYTFDQTAYDSAFGRAKDQQAKTISGAMAGLKNAMSARGLQGSGIEAEGMADIVGGAAGGLGEFTRDQATKEVEGRTRAGEFAANLNQGTRGQNINLALSLSQLLNQGLRY